MLGATVNTADLPELTPYISLYTQVIGITHNTIYVQAQLIIYTIIRHIIPSYVTISA